MKSLKLFSAAVLALTLSLPAMAAPDPAHFQLTPAFMAKLEALQKDPAAQKMSKKDDDSDEDDNKSKGKKSDGSVDDMIRKLEATPGAKAILAKHGLTIPEFAVAMAASLHAGMYVMFESAMDKKKAAELYNTYTKEQKANIVLMRTVAAKSK